MREKRTLNKKPKTRPKKKAGDRRRREMNQKRRLVALGLDQDVVAKMNYRQVRDLLKRPARVTAP
jgi:hypothetical protein